MSQSDTRATEMSDLGENCVRLTPNLTNLEYFHVSFQYIFIWFIAAAAPEIQTPLDKEKDRAKLRKKSDRKSIEPTTTAVITPC